MKRIISLMISIIITMFVGIYAQTISKGNKFFDGRMLFSVKSVKNGVAHLVGVDNDGDTYSFNLVKVGKTPGIYKLSKAEDEAYPYGCLWGSKVEYIRKNGMYFLAFYVEEHSYGQIAVLTPDNLKNCMAQQKFAVENNDPIKATKNYLMNLYYLRNYDLDTLTLMLNTLQKVKKPNIIQKSNQQVIAYYIYARLNN